MNQNAFKVVVSAAATGLCLAAIAIEANKRMAPKSGREPWSSREDASHYDYIIVGGGTAGCVLASRLAEDPGVSVLLLEAGEDADSNIFVTTPLFNFGLFYHPRHEWGLKTVPQVHINNRVLKQIRGRMMGGCSSINGMMYTRGPSADYDEWANKFGNPGWTFEEVFPYFKKSEGFCDPQRSDIVGLGHDPTYATFEPEYHGTEGPWNVTYNFMYGSAKGFVRASLAEGVPLNRDPNGSSDIGVSRVQRTQTNDGTRMSTSKAFLSDPKIVPGGGRRGTIRVVTQAHVLKLLLEDRHGVPTAVGVVFKDARNVEHQVYARQEVVLSAGSLHSPTLLLASGIGHQIHKSIPFVHSLPGVGRNLSDHVGCGLVYQAPDHCHTVHNAMSPMNAPKALYNYFRHGTGPVTSQNVEAIVAVRLEDIDPEFVAREKAAGTWREMASGPNVPHVELMFLSAFYHPDEYRPGMKDNHNYYTVFACLLNPVSRGNVEVNVDPKSKSPLMPTIDQNLFSDPFDVRVMKVAIRFAQRVAKHMQADPTMAGVPWGATKTITDSDDDELLEAFIRTNSNTFFHTCGTTKMGPASDPEAVVDHRLKVHGVDRLRVIDAGVIPKVIAGHTCAATIMIAEKAADMIKQARRKEE
ncbi:hypothetical protein BGZ94_010417 [Podila epigama]|nr:hypothetical protein BGZ94_010417 [Podila epigama]